MRACLQCGCTEKRACLEFDAKGYAHACHWALQNVCSGCFFEKPPPHFETPDTRLRLEHRRGKPYLQVLPLAGMVARPRSTAPQKGRRR